MQLQICAKNVRLRDMDRANIEGRLQFAFGRLERQIMLVTVVLADLNGPRSGSDKQCRLIVRLTSSGKITIEERHSNVLVAVALAAHRASQALGRRLQRWRAAKRHRASYASLPYRLTQFDGPTTAQG
jgi:putative sigma-54 modulation protein